MLQRLEDIKFHKEKFLPLTIEEEAVGKAIINAAYVVHKALGSGLLEKVYETCFCHVLAEDGYFVKRQLDVPIVFQDITLNEGLRLDVLVNDIVICRLGYLINFNVPLIKNGINRMVL